MAALDMRTVVYYRRLPAPSSGASGEVSIGFSSSYQDPFAAVLTTACVRGADMTDFPGTAAPFEGDWGEASGTATGAVEYAYYDASKRGDLVLNFIGATTGVGAADQPRMEELSRASGTGMTGAAAVTRVLGTLPREIFGWAGVTGEYSMFMVPLRPRHFGSLQVEITPQAARNAGARWRVEGGEWLASGEVIGGEPSGSWLLDFTDVPGYRTPALTAEVPPDGLATVTARYQREGTPEVVGTAGFQGTATAAGGFALPLSGDTPWEGELVLMTLSAAYDGALTVSWPDSGLSAYPQRSAPTPMFESPSAAETGVHTRVYFMKRPQLLAGAHYDGGVVVTPADGASDVPCTLNLVFLRGVDLAAFSDPWAATAAFPAPFTVSGTGVSASHAFDPQDEPVNGEAVFSVLSSGGPLGGVTDPTHTELWNSPAPGNGFASVGAVRQFEPELDDALLTWDVAATERAWELMLVVLPDAGRGDLQAALNTTYIGEPALWRIDGREWHPSGERVPLVSAGYHWMEFFNPDARRFQTPSPRWVVVAPDVLNTERASYSLSGIPHPFQMLSFEGVTDSHGSLQVRAQLPADPADYTAELLVAAMGSPSGTATSAAHSGTVALTEWARSDDAQADSARSTLFARSNTTIPATSVWNLGYGVGDTRVWGSVMLFRNVDSAAMGIGGHPPYPNAAGGGGITSPANVLNTLTGATQWDTLCGAIKASGTASLDTHTTSSVMNPAWLWWQKGYNAAGAVNQSFVGYASLANVGGLPTAAQGPTFIVSRFWGGAEGMVPHATGTVTVTIDPPVLAARPEMLWQVAGSTGSFASGASAASLCGWQQLTVAEPSDYRLTDPEELWVEVGEGQTVSRTLHYAPLAPTGIRVFILPENAAQGGATWRVKDRTPADTWHGDGYIYTGITAQDVNRGCVEIEFTGATGYGDFDAPPTACYAVTEGSTTPHTVTWNQYGSVNFTVEPPEAAAQNPLWRFAGTESWHTLADTAEAAVGSRTVEFSELEGWRAPVLDVFVAHNETRTYTVRYEPWGTPRVVGQSSWAGDTTGLTNFDIALPRPLPDFSVVALTWQADHAAPQVLLDQDQGTYTLWAESANGAVRAALYYLKNPNTQETEGNVLTVLFGGTSAAFSMQAVCLFLDDVDLAAPLYSSTHSGTAPLAAHGGPEVVPNDGLYLDAMSVASGDFSPNLDTATNHEVRDLVLLWKGQAESKALLGGGALVTGKAVTGGSYENGISWACASDWAGVCATVPAAKGQLRVNIFPPEAVAAGVQWNANPRSLGYTASGATRGNVALGVNPLSHNNMNGWIPDPALPAAPEVLPDVLNEADYHFIQGERGGVRVNIFPAAAAAAGAQWRLTSETGMAWQAGGAAYTAMAQVEKNYIIEFNPPAGWTPPARQNVWVSQGEVEEVTVVFTQAGALRVSLERDGAPMAGDFWIYAPAQRLAASGETIPDIPPGVYEVFTPVVNGYLSPQNNRVTVNPGETADVVMRYERLPEVGVNELLHPGSVTGIVNPPEAAAAGARWRVEGYAWANSGQAIPNVRPGVVRILSEDVEGWLPVAPFDAVVSAGRGSTVNIYYFRVEQYTLGLIPEITAVQGQRTAVQVLVPEGMPPGTVLSYSLSRTPDGPVTFNPSSGVFTYTAAETDVESFQVTFCATPPGGDPVCQAVTVYPVAGPVTEDDTVKPDNPDSFIPDENSRDYITISEDVHMKRTWNAMPEVDVRNLRITGKTLRIQDGHANNLFNELDASAVRDLYSVTLFAENVVVAGTLRIPGARVTITARNLVFEDLPGNPGQIDLTPYAVTTAPPTGSVGSNGQDSGDLYLNIEHCTFDNSSSVKRIVLRGARGQDGGAGQDGVSGGTVEVRHPDSWGWQDKVKNAGVDSATRTEMVGRVIYLHNADETAARGAAVWPTPHTPIIARGTPGKGGDYGTLRAPFSQFAALIDADYGDPGALDPHVPVVGAMPVPDPGFWLWIGDPDATGPSASTRALAESQGLQLEHRKKDDWEVYWYRNEDPNQTQLQDTTAGGLIRGNPAPPLEYTPAGAEDAWICPEVLQPALMHLKDTYLNGNALRVRNTAMEYLNRIYGRLAYHPPAADEARILETLAGEFRVIYDRAAAGLDYFGNPPGWTPMLSFEANASLFRDEYESAVRTLFLSMWIEDEEHRKETSVAAINANITELERQIAALKSKINLKRADLPGLTTAAQALSVEKANLEAERLALETKLRERAEEEAEDPWWKKALKVTSSLLKVIPLPETQLLGGAIDLVQDFSWENAAQLADNGVEFGLNVQLDRYGDAVDQVVNTATAIDPSVIDSREDAAALYGDYKAKLDAMAQESVKYQEAMRVNGAPQSKVDRIFDELKAKSAAFQELTGKIEDLKTRESAATQKYETLSAELDQAVADLGTALVSLGEQRQTLLTTTRSQDHRSRQYFKDLDQRVRHRLLKYHYYMAKAYEFRTLKPYNQPIRLSQDILTALMQKLAEPDPLTPELRHGPVLSADEVETLKVPFEQDMRAVVERFVDDANAAGVDQELPLTYALSPEQLDTLNRRKRLTINLQQLGILSLGEDNHRIRGLVTDTVAAGYAGGDPDNAYLDISYTHSGVSRMRSRGKVLKFQHYAKPDTTPLQWKARYTNYNGSWTESALSGESLSMLDFIGLHENQFYYCVPSAWADIEIRLDGPYRDGFTVDSLRLAFLLSYTPKPANVSDIYVASGGGVSPRVEVSVPDVVDGKTGGHREFFRQYASAGTVTLTTTPVYGTYLFSHWKLDGAAVPTKGAQPSITVPLSSGHIVEPVFVPAPVTTPNVVGKAYAPRVEPPPGTDMAGYSYPIGAYSDAEYRLVSEGLALGLVRYEQTGDDADKGKVLRQYPTPGMSVARDSAIHIAVSTGTDPAGEDPLDAAMAALLAAFDALDTDDSGGLSWNEALAGYPGLWPEDFYALDADESNELSPEEVGYVPPLCEIGSRLSVFRMLQLFAGDPDADGHLSKDEFQALTGFISIQMNNWGQLDTNGDNRASMPEFEASLWTALGPLFELDTDMDNAVSLAEYQAFHPALPSAVFNAADLTTPKNGLIDCDDLEFVVVTVPDLAGLTQAEADAAIVAAGLGVGQHASEYNDTVPAGEVIQQNPLAGTPAAPGAMVHMVLSLGPQPVPVPDITGMTQAAAEAALTGAGLSVGQVSEAYDATVPAGQVISQNPAAGTEALPGAPVSVVVSLGVRMIAVPDLSGMTAAGAEAVLLGADLTLGAVTEVNSDTVPAGQVMGQSPAPGVEVLEGTAVAVTVSLGPLPVAVPNVTGMAQAAAAAALSGAGLAAGPVSESYSATVPAGSVISQNPAAGTLVLPGAAVALEVSKGPAPAGDIPVPNLAGMTQAQAGAALTAAELSLGTVSEVYNATVPAGQVISQSPAAGVEVAAGTAVNLTVSRGPEPVVVPDVTGMTQANAAAALTGAGLDVGQVVQAFSDTIPVGRVISQDPAADAEVPPGTAVDLEVSKGPAPPGDIAVPSLAGMTQAQAGAALTGATLALGAVTEAYSATVPAGQVISQNPAAGAMVAAATPVNIVLSKGPHPADGVAVPDTAYMTGAVAEGMITGDGLTVGQTTEECSGTVPEGRVVRTDPAAGTVVAPGTAVNLHVSSGPCPVAVPNVAGMTQSAAEAAVTGAGLTVGAVTEAFSDTVPAGSVISQDPAAGAQAQPGAAVALVVSKGVDQAVSDAARASLAGMFEDADTDGDGSLSFGEVQAAAPTVTQLVFNALDADGDGLLSAEELGVETGCGCGCKKSDMTVDGLKSRLGDLFLGGLALALLAAAGRRRMP